MPSVTKLIGELESLGVLLKKSQVNDRRAVIVSIQFICLGLSFLIINYAWIVSGTDPSTAGCSLGAFLAA